MLLQESVKVIPEFRHPVQNLDEILIGQVSLVLRLHHLPVQVAHQEAIGRLHVVGEGHHSEVVKTKTQSQFENCCQQFVLSLFCWHHFISPAHFRANAVVWKTAASFKETLTINFSCQRDF